MKSQAGYTGWKIGSTPMIVQDADGDHNGPVGQITAHVSGDEDGPICGWSFNVGDGRIVYCGEISNARFAELDEDERAAYGGKPFGWFLMCYWPDRSEVWAKCGTEEQSERMVTLIGSMLYAGHLWRQEDAGAAREMVDNATRE